MADPYAQAVGFSRFSFPGPQGLKAPYIPEIPVHYRVPGLTMDLRPELTIALERTSLCCPVIRKCLADSVEASHSAVKHAHDAWDQLESVTCNLMSVFELVDQPGLEDLKVAFKEAKVLTRDRVVWQAMGRFRDPLEMVLSINYLSDIVKGNQTRISQLRHAYVKIHSDMLLQLMGRHDHWEAFLQNLWQKPDDLVFTRLNQFREHDLQIGSDYQSLMRLPDIVLQAMSKTKTIIYVADHLHHGRIGPSSDIARLHGSLEKILSCDVMILVQQKFQSCRISSLNAVQHAVGAWAHLQQKAWKKTGVWRTDDGSRKFRNLENLFVHEIVLTGCAYIGNAGLADFQFLERVLRHEISFRGMPRVDVPYLIRSVRTRHASAQKEIWQELICSEQTWARRARTIQKVAKAHMEVL